MADLAPTVASVLADSGSSQATGPFQGTAAVDLTQMQPVYQDTLGWKPADAAGNATRAKATAITLNAAKAGQPISLLSGGGLNPGATLVKGKQYVVSHNSGKVAPVEDLVTTDYVQYLFFADTTTHGTLNIGAQGPLIQL